jgi:shikimate kinase
MAAGKSEVARILAEELGWPAFDIDALVEEEAGAPVSEIFATRGEAWFRERERVLTKRLLGRRGVIVAPGGGWAAEPGRLTRLPPHVVSVWLRVSAEEAVRRAGGMPGARPLMADEARMGALLGEREPLYRAARLHLDTEAAPPVEVARRIIDHMAER